MTTRCLDHVTQSTAHTLTWPQAVQERELSNAWVALWGRRRRLDPDSKTWVDSNDFGDAAVRAAARRVVFLEAHPEQVCDDCRNLCDRQDISSTTLCLFLSTFYLDACLCLNLSLRSEVA